MQEVCVTHCVRQRAIPICLVCIDEHAVNHIFGLVIQFFRSVWISLTRLEVCEHGQIPRQIVAITYFSAHIDSNRSPFFGRPEVAPIAVDFCEIKHCLCRHPKKGVLPPKIARSF